VKKTVWLAIAFALVFVAFVVITTFGGNRVRCEVCMEFNGRRDCRSAQAATREEALRTAITNACAQLSGGVVETSQCEHTVPASVVWK
jgi:hypothetical protein